jgi:membrane protein YqaA with SNARE-associated domain
MKTLLTWLQSFAATIGGPGLFIIAFLDSSFLSFPEVIDLLVVAMAVQRPSLMVYYAAMATVGSLAGCLALYAVGRRGGQALLHSRFGSERLQRATQLFQRYGIWAIIIPSLLPPPAPFKLFVLLGGVTGIPPVRFAIAVTIGRGIRYFGAGLIGIWYGRQAIEFLHRNGRPIALVFAAAALGLLVWLLRRRRTPASL